MKRIISLGIFLVLESQAERLWKSFLHLVRHVAIGLCGWRHRRRRPTAINIEQTQSKLPIIIIVFSLWHTDTQTDKQQKHWHNKSMAYRDGSWAPTAFIQLQLLQELNCLRSWIIFPAIASLSSWTELIFHGWGVSCRGEWSSRSWIRPAQSSSRRLSTWMKSIIKTIIQLHNKTTIFIHNIVCSSVIFGHEIVSLVVHAPQQLSDPNSKGTSVHSLTFVRPLSSAWARYQLLIALLELVIN